MRNRLARGVLRWSAPGASYFALRTPHSAFGGARPLLLLAVLLVANFALPRLLPGDPVAAPQAGGGQDAPVALTPEARAQLLAYYGLDRPLPAQFGHFLLATARGDLGFSIAFNQPVAALVARRLGWTLFLAGGALGLAATLGGLLGLLAAWRAGRRGTGGWSLALLLPGALPEFVIGLALVVVFTVWWPVLPGRGALSPFRDCGGTALAACAGDALRHAALPGLTLTLAHLPAFFLLMRAAALQELGQGYATVARAKGLREGRVALGHVLRNALPPVLALVGVRVGLLLGGAVVVETVFAYPGLGLLTFQAIAARDYPLLQALFLLSGLTVLTANLGADLLLRLVDPRREA